LQNSFARRALEVKDRGFGPCLCFLLFACGARKLRGQNDKEALVKMHLAGLSKILIIFFRKEGTQRPAPLS
jgi:hypothetical protein